MEPEDARRVRMAATAVVGLIAAGIGTILALSFIGAGCRAIGCDVEAWLMLGLIVSWSGAAAILVGRLAWQRSFGSKISAAFLLGWFALHFAAPGAFISAYISVLGAAGGGLDAWAMLLWLALGVVMVVAGWFGADLADKIR